MAAGRRNRFRAAHKFFSRLARSHIRQLQDFYARVRTLYWASTASGEVVIASRWESMPAYGSGWSDEGLAEMLRYRWMSGTATLQTGHFATSRLAQGFVREERAGIRTSHRAADRMARHISIDDL